MRLITHNLLRCNAKRVKTGFPLKIVVAKVTKAISTYLVLQPWPHKTHVYQSPSIYINLFNIQPWTKSCSYPQAAVKKKEFNAEFIKNFLPKVDWAALVGTVT